MTCSSASALYGGERSGAAARKSAGCLNDASMVIVAARPGRCPASDGCINSFEGDDALPSSSRQSFDFGVEVLDNFVECSGAGAKLCENVGLVVGEGAQATPPRPTLPMTRESIHAVRSDSRKIARLVLSRIWGTPARRIETQKEVLSEKPRRGIASAVWKTRPVERTGAEMDLVVFALLTAKDCGQECELLH